ncbi:ParB/RepB/Spo0J family partition protein [Rhodoplanes roseus]|uniref:ParB-like N-terminal domain-containing protein n=1 Tax=Rhodoplanes roseus TaxID=29409 RepID=A0A327KLG9_9BRAD|nr:ParB/RepB/Spo0J family partition protein [Rhodoplanes roseus]RAI39091.1 hypothetical protein CH341_26575 [Rhodoplanes roseus]
MDVTTTTMRRFGDRAEIAFVPLYKLRPGNEAPAGSINVRKTDDPSELPPLKASIEAKGVLQSVLACSPDEGSELYLAIGNRRLRALRALLAEGRIADDFPVPTIILRGVTPADARAASLAENIERAPLHPVDRFEAFAELQADGRSADDIAAQFGLARREVNQSLALGALSPTIRAAWRNGQIGATIAQLYTLSPSHKVQDATFARMKKEGRANSDWALRSALKADDAAAQRSVEFVGLDAYEARGGKVTRDLFGTSHVVGDAKLAKAMADEKLLAECDRLIAEGWKWARPRDGVKDFWSYRTSDPKGKPTDDESAELARLRAIVEIGRGFHGGEPSEAEEAAAYTAEADIARLEAAIAARSYTPRQKAKAGCFVEVEDGGRLVIHYGRIDPADARKAEAEQKAKEKAKQGDDPESTDKPAGPAISNALAHRLSCQLTAAAAEAIDDDPELALSVALAALTAPPARWGDDRAVALKVSGMRAVRDPGEIGADEEEEFDGLLETFGSRSVKEQLRTLARFVGDALDFRVEHAARSPLLQTAGEEGRWAEVICNAIDPAAMNAALRKAFDAPDYFGAVSARLAAAAIVEMGHPPPRSMKKAEVVETAVRLAGETGWLPPELRTVHYDGPGGALRPIAEAAE